MWIIKEGMRSIFQKMRVVSPPPQMRQLQCLHSTHNVRLTLWASIFVFCVRTYVCIEKLLLYYKDSLLYSVNAEHMMKSIRCS